MKKQRLCPLLIALLMVCMVPTFSFASLFIKVDFQEIISKSSLIVQGKILSVESAWNSDRSMIYSYATLQIEKNWKMAGLPETTKTIVIKEVGGTVGEFTSMPIGFPKLVEGQEVIVFLSPWEDDGNYRIYAYAQGKFNIIQDSATNERSVLREDALQGDVEIIGEDASNPLTKKMSYDQFIGLLNQNLAKSKASAPKAKLDR